MWGNSQLAKNGNLYVYKRDLYLRWTQKQIMAHVILFLHIVNPIRFYMKVHVAEVLAKMQ